MRFIDIILESSGTRESRLYKPAQKAEEKPDTGVTVQIPAALNVIKDCATMAVRYIPHYVFGLYANPFDALKGKFKYADVKEFVEASHKDIVMNQLLVIILNKIGAPLPQKTNTPAATTHDNPYGDYELYDNVTVETPVSSDPVSLICKAFNVAS